MYFKVYARMLCSQYRNGGGPIIAWQIENEYGSFGDDTKYLLQIQKVVRYSIIINLYYYAIVKLWSCLPICNLAFYRNMVVMTTAITSS